MDFALSDLIRLDLRPMVLLLLSASASNDLHKY